MMSSTPPNYELDDDAIDSLAVLRGWYVEYQCEKKWWYLSRQISDTDSTVDIRVAENRKQLIDWLLT
jgi:hypothetical protein